MFKLSGIKGKKPRLIQDTSWNKNLCSLFFRDLEKNTVDYSLCFLLTERQTRLSHSQLEHTYHGLIQVFSMPYELEYANILVNLYFHKADTIRSDSRLGYVTFSQSLTARSDAPKGRLPSIELCVVDENNLQENLSSLFSQIKASSEKGVEVTFNIDISNVVQAQRIGVDEAFNLKWINFSATLI